MYKLKSFSIIWLFMATASNNGVVVEHDNGVLDISMGFSYDSQHHWTFEKGDAREALARIYDPKSTYTFLRTVANPDAVELLSKYVGTRKGKREFPPWEVRLKTKKDDDEEVRFLRFNPDLMDRYLDTLKMLATRYVGEKDYASYSLVEKRGVHNMDRPSISVSWPIIHVVKGGEYQVDKFKGVVNSLNDDEAFEHIREKEAPQNYRMGEIELLRKRKIPPLVVQPREWEVDAKALRNALDFLPPFTLGYEFHQGSWVDD